jgi:type I restriction enzyme R subunit
MALGGEMAAVQNPFVKYAREAGWVYLSPDEARAFRRGEDTSPVLDEVLVEQLQKLNPGIVDRTKAEDLAGRLVRVKLNIEGNRDAWEFLKGLKTVFVEGEGRERNVRFVDPDRLDANTFHVTDEFTYVGGTKAIRTDIQFHVNGMPVLVVETKSARHKDGDQQALGDIKYYHAHGGELFAVAQLFAVTHLIRFLYGDRQRTTRDALDDMLKIVEELRKAKQEREASDLSPEAFAVNWFLKQEGVPKADEVARQVAAAFAEFPHWQTSSHQDQHLRKVLYRALIAGGVSTVVDYAQRIMTMLRGAKA